MPSSYRGDEESVVADRDFLHEARDGFDVRRSVERALLNMLQSVETEITTYEINSAIADSQMDVDVWPEFVRLVMEYERERERIQATREAALMIWDPTEPKPPSFVAMKGNTDDGHPTRKGRSSSPMVSDDEGGEESTARTATDDGDLVADLADVLAAVSRGDFAMQLQSSAVPDTDMVDQAHAGALKRAAAAGNSIAAGASALVEKLTAALSLLPSRKGAGDFTPAILISIQQTLRALVKVVPSLASSVTGGIAELEAALTDCAAEQTLLRDQLREVTDLGVYTSDTDDTRRHFGSFGGGSFGRARTMASSGIAIADDPYCLVKRLWRLPLLRVGMPAAIAMPDSSPSTAIVSIAICNYVALWRLNAGVAVTNTVHDIVNNCCDELIHSVKGPVGAQPSAPVRTTNHKPTVYCHIVRSRAGVFDVATSSVAAAAQLALTVQRQVASYIWPNAIADFAQCYICKDGNSVVQAQLAAGQSEMFPCPVEVAIGILRCGLQSEPMPAGFSVGADFRAVQALRCAAGAGRIAILDADLALIPESQINTLAPGGVEFLDGGVLLSAAAKNPIVNIVQPQLEVRLFQQKAAIKTSALPSVAPQQGEVLTATPIAPDITPDDSTAATQTVAESASEDQPVTEPTIENGDVEKEFTYTRYTRPPRFSSSLLSHDLTCALSFDECCVYSSALMASELSTFAELFRAISPPLLTVPPPTGFVTFVAIAVPDIVKLWRFDFAVAAASLKLFHSYLNDLAADAGGFVTKWTPGAVVMALPHALMGCSVALKVHEGLMALNWPVELLTYPSAQQIRDLWKGLRVRVALHGGKVTFIRRAAPVGPISVPNDAAAAKGSFSEHVPQSLWCHGVVQFSGLAASRVETMLKVAPLGVTILSYDILVRTRDGLPKDSTITSFATARFRDHLSYEGNASAQSVPPPSLFLVYMNSLASRAQHATQTAVSPSWVPMWNTVVQEARAGIAHSNTLTGVSVAEVSTWPATVDALQSVRMDAFTPPPIPVSTVSSSAIKGKSLVASVSPYVESSLRHFVSESVGEQSTPVLAVKFPDLPAICQTVGALSAIRAFQLACKTLEEIALSLRGTFMGYHADRVIYVFREPLYAFLAAIVLQESLLSAPWDPELLEFTQCNPILQADSNNNPITDSTSLKPQTKTRSAVGSNSSMLRRTADSVIPPGYTLIWRGLRAACAVHTGIVKFVPTDFRTAEGDGASTASGPNDVRSDEPENQKMSETVPLGDARDFSGDNGMCGIWGPCVDIVSSLVDACPAGSVFVSDAVEPAVRHSLDTATEISDSSIHGGLNNAIPHALRLSKFMTFTQNLDMERLRGSNTNNSNNEIVVSKLCTPLIKFTICNVSKLPILFAGHALYCLSIASPIMQRRGELAPSFLNQLETWWVQQRVNEILQLLREVPVMASVPAAPASLPSTHKEDRSKSPDHVSHKSRLRKGVDRSGGRLTTPELQVVYMQRAVKEWCALTKTFVTSQLAPDDLGEERLMDADDFIRLWMTSARRIDKELALSPLPPGAHIGDNPPLPPSHVVPIFPRSGSRAPRVDFQEQLHHVLDTPGDEATAITCVDTLRLTRSLMAHLNRLFLHIRQSLRRLNASSLIGRRRIDPDQRAALFAAARDIDSPSSGGRRGFTDVVLSALRLKEVKEAQPRNFNTPSASMANMSPFSKSPSVSSMSAVPASPKRRPPKQKPAVRVVDTFDTESRPPSRGGLPEGSKSAISAVSSSVDLHASCADASQYESLSSQIKSLQEQLAAVTKRALSAEARLSEGAVGDVDALRDELATVLTVVHSLERAKQEHAEELDAASRNKAKIERELRVKCEELESLKEQASADINSAKSIASKDLATRTLQLTALRTQLMELRAKNAGVKGDAAKLEAVELMSGRAEDLERLTEELRKSVMLNMENDKLQRLYRNECVKVAKLEVEVEFLGHASERVTLLEKRNAVLEESHKQVVFLENQVEELRRTSEEYKSSHAVVELFSSAKEEVLELASRVEALEAELSAANANCSIFGTAAESGNENVSAAAKFAVDSIGMMQRELQDRLTVVQQSRSAAKAQNVAHLKEIAVLRSKLEKAEGDAAHYKSVSASSDERVSIYAVELDILQQRNAALAAAVAASDGASATIRQIKGETGVPPQRAPVTGAGGVNSNTVEDRVGLSKWALARVGDVATEALEKAHGRIKGLEREIETLRTANGHLKATMTSKKRTPPAGEDPDVLSENLVAAEQEIVRMRAEILMLQNLLQEAGIPLPQVPVGLHSRVGRRKSSTMFRRGSNSSPGNTLLPAVSADARTCHKDGRRASSFVTMSEESRAPRNRASSFRDGGTLGTQKLIAVPHRNLSARGVQSLDLQADIPMVEAIYVPDSSSTPMSPPPRQIIDALNLKEAAEQFPDSEALQRDAREANERIELEIERRVSAALTKQAAAHEKELESLHATEKALQMAVEEKARQAAADKAAARAAKAEIEAMRLLSDDTQCFTPPLIAGEKQSDVPNMFVPRPPDPGLQFVASQFSETVVAESGACLAVEPDGENEGVELSASLATAKRSSPERMTTAASALDSSSASADAIPGSLSQSPAMRNHKQNRTSPPNPQPSALSTIYPSVGALKTKSSSDPDSLALTTNDPAGSKPRPSTTSGRVSATTRSINTSNVSTGKKSASRPQTVLKPRRVTPVKVETSWRSSATAWQSHEVDLTILPPAPQALSASVVTTSESSSPPDTQAEVPILPPSISRHHGSIKETVSSDVSKAGSESSTALLSTDHVSPQSTATSAVTNADQTRNGIEENAVLASFDGTRLTYAALSDPVNSPPEPEAPPDRLTSAEPKLSGAQSSVPSTLPISDSIAPQEIIALCSIGSAVSHVNSQVKNRPVRAGLSSTSGTPSPSRIVSKGSRPASSSSNFNMDQTIVPLLSSNYGLFSEVKGLAKLSQDATSHKKTTSPNSTFAMAVPIFGAYSRTVAKNEMEQSNTVAIGAGLRPQSSSKPIPRVSAVVQPPASASSPYNCSPPPIDHRSRVVPYTLPPRPATTSRTSRNKISSHSSPSTQASISAVTLELDMAPRPSTSGPLANRRPSTVLSAQKPSNSHNAVSQGSMPSDVAFVLKEGVIELKKMLPPSEVAPLSPPLGEL